MSDAKHTPGPWRTDEHGSIVCYPDGLAIGVLSRQMPSEEVEANHRLIVAAPDLLEALRIVLGQYIALAVFGGDDPEDFKSVIQARAAIAKAEGRS